MLDPEEGRGLPLRLRDKGFPKVPGRTAAPVPPTPAVSGLFWGQHAAPSESSSSSRSSSPSSGKTSYPAAIPLLCPSHNATLRAPAASLDSGVPQNALPQANSPLSSARAPHPQQPFPPPAPRPSPVSSRRRQVLGSLPGPSKARGRCPGCAQPPPRCRRQCAGHTRAPHPSLTPAPMLRCSQPGGCLLREGRARPPAGTPCDGHCSVTRSFG